MPLFGLGKARDSKAARDSRWTNSDPRDSRFSFSPRESKRSPRDSARDPRNESIKEEPSSVEKLKRRMSNQGLGKATAVEIGMPTNVKHVQHMGYSEEGGFKFDDQPIPMEWKALFRAAGVKKKDLEDKATAKLIVDTITANMTPEELAKLPPLPGVTERVEAAQARRDVQRQRAEQAKLMMMMMDQNGGAPADPAELAKLFGKTGGDGPALPPPHAHSRFTSRGDH